MRWPSRSPRSEAPISRREEAEDSGLDLTIYAPGPDRRKAQERSVP